MDPILKIYKSTDDVLYSDVIPKVYSTKILSEHLIQIGISPSDGALSNVIDLTDKNYSWKSILREIMTNPQQFVNNDGITTYHKVNYSRTINKEKLTVELYIGPNGIYLAPYKPLVLFTVNVSIISEWANIYSYNAVSDIPIHRLYADSSMISNSFYSVLNNYLIELFYDENHPYTCKYDVIPKSKYKVVYCEMNGMEKYNSLKCGSFQLRLSKSELDEFFKTIKIYD